MVKQKILNNVSSTLVSIGYWQSELEKELTAAEQKQRELDAAYCAGTKVFTEYSMQSTRREQLVLQWALEHLGQAERAFQLVQQALADFIAPR